MSLQGDLATLDLADLLQNLESHERSGLLTIKDGERESHLYFTKGKLALCGTEERPGLMDVLVASGRVSDAALQSARKKRRRSKRSLGEMLVAGRAIGADELEAIARARLLDEVCELVAERKGAFTFSPGPIPRGLFDPEERRLDLALPSGALLMESARREDHWRLIRDRVPSDSAHYLVQRDAKMLRQPDCPELARDLARLLDGTRSVSEVMASFPHCRFEAYQTLADLSERHALRLAGGDDLVALAQRLTRHDPERAWKIVERGLRETPHHLGLLTQQVAMAESLDRLESASEALKLVVHLNLEAGERDVAKQGLERAKRLSPSDTALWERSLALAIDERRAADAVRDGRHLVELYRAPGLHRKAERVLATLVRLHPGSWELRRDWAHCLADCGDPAAAVEVLSRHARKLLAAERDDDAAAVLEEILAIDPGQRAVKAKLAEIDEGLLARRRERRRRLVRRLVAAFVLTVLAVGLVLESRARFEYSRAERVISEQSLIERGHYEEALGLLERVRQRYPWCTISLFELRGRIRTLESKAAALRASDDA